MPLGKVDVERCPSTFFGFEVDGAVQLLDDGLHDHEAEARAAKPTLVGPVRLGEFLKDPLSKLGRDARSRDLPPKCEPDCRNDRRLRSPYLPTVRTWQRSTGDWSRLE